MDKLKDYILAKEKEERIARNRVLLAERIYRNIRLTRDLSEIRLRIYNMGNYRSQDEKFLSRKISHAIAYAQEKDRFYQSPSNEIKITTLWKKLEERTMTKEEYEFIMNSSKEEIYETFLSIGKRDSDVIMTSN